MKTTITLTIFFLLTISGYNQQKLSFNYDTAGNQILRERVCVNCSSAKSTQAKQDTVFQSLDNLSRKLEIEYF
ncbi:hypothetical protein [Galbibacter mesophilus]|uniref:hypothetical protein n=1 Tax=Galbibacter mesophilus TaxID=379069 RepID=UPI00191E2C1F|nr:hypothetical protein [Galbibacter mesophilus]MCM5663625.1 hypothetical protein [Galbibacter mesophilus]